MQQGKPDRYVSFAGIEGDKNSIELVQVLRSYIDTPEYDNPFWDKFRLKLAQIGRPEVNGGRSLDELFLIHSYINNIRDLFEQVEDQDALALLEKIETESC